MKKLISVLLIAVILLLPIAAKADLPNVVDIPKELTDTQYDDILARVESLSRTYEIDTIIVILDTLDGADAQAAADDIFDNPEYGYGYGSDYSGALLLYSVEDRDLAISTYGKGITALTDRRIENLFDVLVEYLRDGRTYDGLCAYLSTLEGYYASYENGEYEDDGEPMPFYGRLFFGVVIGLIAAAVTVGSMKSKMQTARRQSGAVNYIAPGSYDLYNSRDIFLYSQTSRTRRESSSSGGGSSTHHSSSGRSHGGGSRHF